MTAFRKLRLVVLLLVLGCTVGCDQTSKHIARTELGRLGSITLPGGLGELRLAENSGAFLSLGDSLSPPMRAALLTVGVGAALSGLLAYLIVRTGLSWLSFTGLAMAWAGGMSNLIDRIFREGLVTDFVILRVGPLHTGVFNVADMVILLGVAMLIAELWRRDRSKVVKPSAAN